MPTPSGCHTDSCSCRLLYQYLGSDLRGTGTISGGPCCPSQALFRKITSARRKSIGLIPQFSNVLHRETLPCTGMSLQQRGTGFLSAREKYDPQNGIQKWQIRNSL